MFFDVYLLAFVISYNEAVVCHICANELTETKRQNALLIKYVEHGIEMAFGIEELV
jgi:hypothetical protein